MAGKPLINAGKCVKNEVCLSDIACRVFTSLTDKQKHEGTDGWRCVVASKKNKSYKVWTTDAFWRFANICIVFIVPNHVDSI